MTTQYCLDCGAEREFTTRTRDETYEVRGESFTTPVTVAICAVCEKALYDQSRDSQLLIGVYNLYRKAHDLLLPEQIREIRGKYGLSQKAFATLLGMSEATVNRYERGALQEETHDNLMRWADNPLNMAELLNRRGLRLGATQRQRVSVAIIEQGAIAEQNQHRPSGAYRLIARKGRRNRWYTGLTPRSQVIRFSTRPHQPRRRTAGLR